jgi:threonine/homoserine/homoserine lactone efflux protein
VAVANPKTILFYAAFFPQFVSPSLPAAPQIAAMSVAMLAIAVASDSLYARCSSEPVSCSHGGSEECLRQLCADRVIE